jgi:hypothetical protein
MQATEKLNAKYDVGTGAALIDLTVTIGQGCTGPISVYLDGDHNASGANEITTTLGTADAVKNKLVEVFSTSNQPTGGSPVASVTYHFEGGPNPGRFTNPPDGKSQPFGTDREVQFDDSFTMS